MRPNSVKWFEILAWTACGAAIIYLLHALIVFSSYGVNLRGSALTGLIVITVLTIAAGLTSFMATRKRSGAARWIFVAVAVIFALLQGYALIRAGGLIQAIQLILLLVQVGALIGAIVFAAMPTTSAWFRGQHAGAYPPYPGHQGGFPPHGGYPPQPHLPGGYPQQPHQPGAYPFQQHPGGYPPQGGHPAQSHQQSGYPPQHQAGGYPPQQGGYPSQQPGFAPHAHPQGQPHPQGYPPQQQHGHPPPQGEQPSEHPSPNGYPPAPGGYPPR